MNRGSEPGKLNGWERAYALMKSGGVALLSFFAYVSHSMQDNMMAIVAVSPYWVVVVVVAVTSVIIYVHETHVMKNTDNSPKDKK